MLAQIYIKPIVDWNVGSYVTRAGLQNLHNSTDCWDIVDYEFLFPSPSGRSRQDWKRKKREREISVDHWLNTNRKRKIEFNDKQVSLLLLM